MLSDSGMGQSQRSTSSFFFFPKKFSFTLKTWDSIIASLRRKTRRRKRVVLGLGLDLGYLFIWSFVHIRRARWQYRNKKKRNKNEKSWTNLDGGRQSRSQLVLHRFCSNSPVTTTLPFPPETTLIANWPTFPLFGCKVIYFTHPW